MTSIHTLSIGEIGVVTLEQDEALVASPSELALERMSDQPTGAGDQHDVVGRHPVGVNTGSDERADRGIQPEAPVIQALCVRRHWPLPLPNPTHGPSAAALRGRTLPTERSAGSDIPVKLLVPPEPEHASKHRSPAPDRRWL